eukprot:1027151-Ditylum_brightwellii.AAC.1
MKGIQDKFKLKGNNIEEPGIYLGAKMSKMSNVDGIEYWSFLSDQYCAVVVFNIKSIYEKKEGVQWYEELIGSLRWTVEFGRLDILLETSLVSTYLAMPRKGHLEQVLYIIGYLKYHKKLQLMLNCSSPNISDKLLKSCDWFDFYRDAKEVIPPNMPEPRELSVPTLAFFASVLVDSKVTRYSQAKGLIFLNKAPIHWYSKQQATVEVSTFSAEFIDIRTAAEMVEAM